MHHVELRWLGPYRWYGDGEDIVFNIPEAHEAGLYLWTVPYEELYLTYYVGETGRSFAARFEEHTKDYLSGFYRIYDPREFGMGIKRLVWEGMWKPGTRGRTNEFLNRQVELSPVILDLLSKFRLFIAPLNTEQRVRQRVESAVADRLYRQPGLIGTFQDGDIRYWSRRSDEEPIRMLMTGYESILGLCRTLNA